MGLPMYKVFLILRFNYFKDNLINYLMQCMAIKTSQCNF